MGDGWLRLLGPNMHMDNACVCCVLILITLITDWALKNPGLDPETKEKTNKYLHVM